MRDDIVGTSTGWTDVALEPATLRLFLDATELDISPYTPGGEDAILPPAVLAALRPDADELGVPTDAPVRLNAGNRFSWRSPVRTGTLLQRRTRVADAYQKPGSSGRLEFYVLHSEYRVAQTGTTVAEAEATTIRRYPDPDPPQRRAGRTTARGNAAESGGMELPARTFVPTARQLVKYSVATGDYYEAHYDHPFAIEHGLPGVIVHGLLKLCLCTRAMHDWFGPGWFVQELDVQYRGMDLVGRPWTVSGTGPPHPDGMDTARIEFSGVSEHGSRTVAGSATLRRCEGLRLTDGTGTAAKGAGS